MPRASLCVPIALVVLSGCATEGSAPTDARAPRRDAGGVDAAIPPLDGARVDAPPLDAGGGVDAAIVAASPAAGARDVRRSAGCATGEGLPEGEARFMLGGLERLYRLRLPAGYTRDRAWPLVLALHPNGGNVGYWDAESGARNVRALARDEAIVLMAQARAGDWRGDLPAELAYFDRVIGTLTSALCVDERRIFSMGFSGGGSFSGVLGCMRSDIRAIASGGAVIYFDEAECVGEPAAWITIGTDELVAGRAAFRDFFRDRAGCDATSMPTAPTPCVAWDGCDEGQPVHYCQHDGGHVWPAFGTQAAWDFFQRFF